MSNNPYKIISKLIWIDAKVNNGENRGYQNLLKNKYNLNILAFEDAASGIMALEDIQFEFYFCNNKWYNLSRIFQIYEKNI